jgi:hypothetical protein
LTQILGQPCEFQVKQVLYGSFVGARRVLNRQQWRVPARAVAAVVRILEARAGAIAAEVAALGGAAAAEG